MMDSVPRKRGWHTRMTNEWMKVNNPFHLVSPCVLSLHLDHLDHLDDL